jgi:NAD(P)H-quinone oxidoreductase subunit 2
VSIYYYISVIKMMVVKEPQEASDVVKAYPAITWNLAGMQPLRAALVGCVVITAVGGVLSSPLFDWASSTVAGTPILQQAIAAAAISPLG